MRAPPPTAGCSRRSYPEFDRIPLDEHHGLHLGSLPAGLRPDATTFARIWGMHPANHPEIWIQGRLVPVPRWQQAYLRDYHFSGTVSPALPLPEDLRPFLDWAKEAVDPRLGGVLVNWYEGRHYIGPHRDSRDGLIPGCPIVTISLGGERTFRMRPWKGKGFHDVPISEGDVVILPAETNLAWTHEVPFRAAQTARRVSLTFRGFVGTQTG